jgi:hypothetical protein
MQGSRRSTGVHGIVLAAAVAPRLDPTVYLFLALPLFLLLVWFLAYQRERYGAALLWSILLVVVGLVHIAAIYTRLNEGITFDLDLSSISVIIGVVGFLVGIFGIISAVKGLRS